MKKGVRNNHKIQKMSRNGGNHWTRKWRRKEREKKKSKSEKKNRILVPRGIW